MNENDLPQELQDWMNKAEDSMGKEAVDEASEDMDFLYEQFKPDCDSSLIIMITIMMLEGGSQEVFQTSLQTLFFGGIMLYRQWLIDRGVDVRQAEGR